MAKDNGKPPENAPAVVTLSSLMDLPSRDVPVTVKIGKTSYLIPCRAMTYKRYQELGRLVPDPAPPAMAGPKGKMYDYQDPDYLRKRTEAADERLYLRLAEFIQVDIPGDDLKAKADYIAEHMEMGIVRGLSSAMEQTITGGEAHVEARAASFQPV